MAGIPRRNPGSRAPRPAAGAHPARDPGRKPFPITSSASTQVALLLDAKLGGERVSVTAEYAAQSQAAAGAAGSWKLGWTWDLANATLDDVVGRLWPALGRLPEGLGTLRPGAVRVGYASGADSKGLSLGIGDLRVLYASTPGSAASGWGVIHARPIEIPTTGLVATLLGKRITLSRLCIGNVTGEFSEASRQEIVASFAEAGLLLGERGAPQKGFVAAITIDGVGAAPIALPFADAPQAAGPATVPARGVPAVAPPAAAAAASTAPQDAGDRMRKWFNVNRTLGPLRIARVGCEWKEGKVGLLLDASVDIAALRIGLTGLRVRLPPSDPKPKNLEVGLDGLEVSYAAGEVLVAGAFLRRVVEGQPESYDGLAVIKVPAFAIAAMGSFTTVGGSNSIFIFGALHGELGGSPSFRLQGIAAGFGYNRRLTLPPIEQVHEFALVRAAMDAAFIRSTQPGQTAGAAMAQLARHITPSLGDYWLAAGIKFNSFEMVTAVALLSVAFGNEIEVALLGLARMSLPRGMEGRAIAHVELALRASVRPNDGTVMVEGRLTDASYLLVRDCRITGGFALCVWFKGPHAGDFVVSLGGYHPKFKVPEHYPVVPRLGIHWQVSSELTFASELYFALTPSCIMLGGRMAAVYASRHVRAWFVVHADFLIAWEPLRYEAEAAIRIGLEVNLDLFSIHAELQVRLRLWGPPFAGVLEVDLGVICVEIAFGEAYRRPARLTAAEFRKAFLPDDASVVSARVDRGLLRRHGEAGGLAIHVVNAHELTLAVESTVPLTGCTGAASGVTQPPATRLGVRPMASAALQSVMSVHIEQRGSGGAYSPIQLHNLRWSPIVTGVPGALWAPAEKEGELQPVTLGDAGLLEALAGLRISLDPIQATGSLPWMRLKTLTMHDIDKAIQPPAAPEDAWIVKGSTLQEAMSADTQRRRNAVLEVMAGNDWPFALETVDLTRTARDARSCFQQDPIVCALGTRDERIVVAA